MFEGNNPNANSTQVTIPKDVSLYSCKTIVDTSLFQMITVAEVIRNYTIHVKLYHICEIILYI